MEGGPATLNLDFAPEENKSPAGWGEVEPDPEITDAELAAVADRLGAFMEKIGLKGRVPLKVLRRVVNAAGEETQGLYRRWKSGRHEIQVGAAENGAGPLGALRHEVVHALRAMGAFSEPQWNALVRAARRNKDIRARIESLYADLPQDLRDEEMVAELYRLWGEDKANTDAPAGLMERIRSFIEALGNALAGRGFHSAASLLRAIERGEVARAGRGRSTNSPVSSTDATASATAKSRPVNPKADADTLTRELRLFNRDPATTRAETDRKERGLISSLLTDAMGAGGKLGKVNLLALVPGRALFSELARNLPSARRYLHLKEEMDAERNRWHEEMGECSTRWRHLLARNGAANRAMMDLMHEATRAGVDPAEDYVPGVQPGDLERARGRNPVAAEAARERLRAEPARKAAWTSLQARFKALPPEFQGMWREVRDSYTRMADAFDEAIIDNVRKAMRAAEKRAERTFEDEMADIRDRGLEGEERAAAEAEAQTKLDRARRRHNLNRKVRVMSLRQMFENNRLQGPYFPLMRFGKYFVTARDEAGKVLTFSLFETEAAQQAFAREMKSAGHQVEAGVTADNFEAKKQIDPSFVAELEGLLMEAGAGEGMLDDVWQHYLTTLPDLSVRQSRIHRKGTPGFSGDAFRAFGRQMFHGSHQLARLKYSIDLQDALDESRREASRATDPNRAGLVVDEMERRHAFVQNPTGSAFAQSVTGFSFIYSPGDRLAFALRANATRTVVEADGRKRHRDVVMEALHGIAPDERAAQRMEAAQAAGQQWLARQGARAGFAPDPVRVTAYRVLETPRATRAKGPRFGVLDLEGALRVTDPAAFLARLEAGFGRAKAFGCGLMLIRRA